MCVHYTSNTFPFKINFRPNNSNSNTISILSVVSDWSFVILLRWIGRGIGKYQWKWIKMYTKKLYVILIKISLSLRRLKEFFFLSQNVQRSDYTYNNPLNCPHIIHSSYRNTICIYMGHVDVEQFSYFSTENPAYNHTVLNSYVQCFYMFCSYKKKIW